MGHVDQDHAAVNPSALLLSVSKVTACSVTSPSHAPFLIPCASLPDANIWMLFFDDVAPHTLRRLAEEAGVSVLLFVLPTFFGVEG